MNRPKSRLHRRPPRCIVIAGPNGAGKTTFAREYLPKVAGVIQFVNADLIAQGLAPLNPGGAAIAAGRLLVKEVTRFSAARMDFAFESTLSGLSHASHLTAWKKEGYRIEIVLFSGHSRIEAVGAMLIPSHSQMDGIRLPIGRCSVPNWTICYLKIMATE